MDTPYQWTVDVDGRDYGGRGGILATRNGLPKILDIFDQYHIKALFFFSTELFSTGFTEGYDYLIDWVKDRGHAVGSHGHFHIKYKSINRMIDDKIISQYYMRRLIGTCYPRYRAPWFQLRTDDPYSWRRNHVSILKQAWFGGRLPENPIFYLHPSDIADKKVMRPIKGDKWPSLFVRLLYGRPDVVLDTFKRLCRLYPGKAVGETTEVDNDTND